MHTEGRYLTVREIWGKTLIHSDGRMVLVSSSSSDSHLHGFSLDMDSDWKSSIPFLHENGWKVADDTLEYNNATSLWLDNV